MTSPLWAGMSGATAEALAEADVVWDSPSADEMGSMPAGNGDVAASLWVESNGDVIFYLAKNDAFSDHPAGLRGLVKLGRLTLRTSPPLFQPGDRFEQRLAVREGRIHLKTPKIALNFRVDANDPTVHLDWTSAEPLAAELRFDSTHLEVTNDGNNFVSPDVLVEGTEDLTWLWRAEKPRVPAQNNFGWGVSFRGDGWTHPEANTLKSKGPERSGHLVGTVESGRFAPGPDRLASLRKRIAEAAAHAPAEAAHLRWWSQFWDRSWILIRGSDAAKSVSDAWIWQRYQNACTSRGNYPIKFNGSLFNVSMPWVARTKGTVRTNQNPADHREWGARYWFQNTRPMYWPMLASGDYDLMKPLFRMYREMLETNRAQVLSQWGHAGSYFAETSPFFGGFEKFSNASPGVYTRHYYTPVLELTAMMLDYYAHTQDEAFAREMLLPTAQDGLDFFFGHFGKDDNGKLLLDPDNCIEMYWKTKNPLPDIAGLHWVLQGLLNLPGPLTAEDQKKEWRARLEALPPVPQGTSNGKSVLLPAETWGAPRNTENPEFYAVYPFRLYGVGKKDLDVALNTWDLRKIRMLGCWHQDPVDAALLGRADECEKMMIDISIGKKHRGNGMRFPGFWGPGHDYTPDVDHGGNLMNALQSMLIQCDGDKIRLLPAWPKRWNADFQLTAPKNTSVHGVVKEGRLVSVDVTPSERRKDVILPE